MKYRKRKNSKKHNRNYNKKTHKKTQKKYVGGNKDAFKKFNDGLIQNINAEIQKNIDDGVISLKRSNWNTSCDAVRTKIIEIIKKNVNVDDMPFGTPIKIQTLLTEFKEKIIDLILSVDKKKYSTTEKCFDAFKELIDNSFEEYRQTAEALYSSEEDKEEREHAEIDEILKELEIENRDLKLDTFNQLLEKQRQFKENITMLNGELEQIKINLREKTNSEQSLKQREALLEKQLNEEKKKHIETTFNLEQRLRLAAEELKNKEELNKKLLI